MVCEVIWSPFALQTYLGNIAYLQEEWTEKEVLRFTKAVDRKLDLLSQFPKVGSPSNKRTGLRKTIVVKRIILIYRYKPRKNVIELVQFFNTWQSPSKAKRK